MKATNDISAPSCAHPLRIAGAPTLIQHITAAAIRTATHNIYRRVTMTSARSSFARARHLALFLVAVPAAFFFYPAPAVRAQGACGLPLPPPCNSNPGAIIAVGAQRFIRQEAGVELIRMERPAPDGVGLIQSLGLRSNLIWTPLNEQGAEPSPNSTPTSETTRTPNASVCRPDVTVELVATQITWGSTGPAVPLKASWQLGTDATQSLFADQNLQSVTTGTINSILPRAPGVAKVAVTFTATASFPDFAAPVFSKTVGNDDAQNAMVLVNGDNYFDKAIAKGVQGPFNGQQDILTILQPYINPTTGLVSLAHGEMLVLYELGTRNTNSAAFDFQDLVLKISGCEVGQEIAVKDHISNPANWNNLPAMISHFFEGPSSTFNRVAASAFTGNGDKLSRVGLVWGFGSGAGIPNEGDPTMFTWRVNFYSDTTDFSNDPFRLTLPQPNYSCAFNTPTNKDWLFKNGDPAQGLNIIGQGTTTGGSFNLFSSEFDLSFLNLLTTPGQEHLISILPCSLIDPISLLAFSTGLSAVGSELDWFKNGPAGGDLGPATLNSLGAPFDYGAYRIVTIGQPVSPALGGACVVDGRCRNPGRLGFGQAACEGGFGGVFLGKGSLCPRHVDDIRPPDCNHNGVGDARDIARGASADANDNGVPDACEIAEGTTVDAHGHGRFDKRTTRAVRHKTRIRSTVRRSPQGYPDDGPLGWGGPPW